MRQAGILAAAGIISLNKMTKRLNEDHYNADYLANELNKLPGFEVDMTKRDINMVYVKSKIDFNDLTKYLHNKDIILGGYVGDYLRIVCHNDITKENIDYLIENIKEYTKK